MLLTFTEISACAVGLKSGVNTTSFFFKGLCHCLGKKWIFILLGLLGLEFKLIPLQFFFNLPTSYLWLDKPRLPVANVWQSLTQVTCSIDLSIDNSGQQGGGWQLGSGWHHHNHWWGQHRRNDASGGAEQDQGRYQQTDTRHGQVSHTEHRLLCQSKHSYDWSQNLFYFKHIIKCFFPQYMLLRSGPNVGSKTGLV